MKRVIAVSIAVGMLLTLVLSTAALAGGGNGAPSGAHFNLNIIGVQNGKDVIKDSGNVIFVPLDTSGRTSRTGLPNAVDILLAAAPAGESFAVLDGNATIDNEAKFQMPADVATTYTVWIRGLGNPKGSADMQGWYSYVDPVTGETVWGSGNIVEIRGHSVNGNPNQKFVDVTNDLLVIGGVPVFSEGYQDFLWTYTNNGQKLVQLRFYPVE